MTYTTKKTTMKKPKRTVECADAIDWLNHRPGELKAIITSLPDMEEIGKSETAWKDFIVSCCRHLHHAMNEKSVIVFYQTDRRHGGKIIDKRTLISEYFLRKDFDLVLSKIALTQNPDTTNLFRPTYTNLFAFSKTATTGKATPDVFGAGKKIYPNAMGLKACRVAIEFIRTAVGKQTIYDPFCGQGSVLKIANDLGFDAHGVDILPEQVKVAQTI